MLAFCLLAASASADTRERTNLDSGWKFHRGAIDGISIAAAGTPVVNWRWIADDRGEKDADKYTSRVADTAGTGWAFAKTGDDVFKGRVGFAWFRTNLPPLTGPIPKLHFDSVDDNAVVYLNGKRLAAHQGWSDAFDVDLKSAWQVNGSNQLAILVENTNGPGGIIGEVVLQQGADVVKTVGPAEEAYDDTNWTRVHLPHDYVIEGKFNPDADANHGYLPTTDAWYRKTFTIPLSDQGKSLWIDFDGVYRDSRVWLNGHYLGRHASGYTSFRFDISPFAKPGKPNVLTVFVDPKHAEGWWYEGGGIYRHVWLNAANRLHLTPLGTAITTKSNLVTVSAEIQSEIKQANGVTLRTQVFDEDGHAPVYQEDRAVNLVPFPGEHKPFFSFRINKPHLWSIEDPHRYRLELAILKGGQEVDRTSTYFGIRDVVFDANRGFLLNGKPVKIQGTCNHQDFAGLGVAIPDSLEYWRVAKLKEMGANAWRMSHNPPNPELLDACDKLGMLVMDENRHLGDSDQVLGEVSDLVLRDRNHPSVIMWSMCNEEQAQGTARGKAMFRAMKATVLKYDTSRPVTAAMNGGWFEDGFNGVEDLMGVNYSYDVYDKFHGQHPLVPVFGSETASTVTTRGEYADDPARVFVSSYNMTDGSWKPAGDRAFVAGTFVWTGFDYKGEPTPYKWPDINSNFGILDMCGFPKDNYFYYQSWWKSQPIVHLLPHWNWPGREGQDVKVVAFSNASEVELFLNGVSQGRKPMPRFEHIEWTVKYAPGTLSARGYDKSGKVIAEDKVTTTGAPAAVRLKTERTKLTPDGEDVVVVEVSVVDAEGHIVPTANDLVRFSVFGAGHIAGVGNGNASDHDPDKASYRHAFNGRCIVIIGAGEIPGKIQLAAGAERLKGASMDFTVVR